MKRIVDELCELIEVAQKDMEKGQIYDTQNMQIIWLQYAKDCHSILISRDDGKTWEDPPFVDAGKWYYNGWLFKLK